MKKFLAIYLGAPDSPNAKKWQDADEKWKEEQTKAGIAAWQAWGKKHQKAILEMGSPLGKTLAVDASGVEKTKNQMTAFTVVEAESHEAAAKMFVNHPHFAIFPGDSIEIMECLPTPG